MWYVQVLDQMSEFKRLCSVDGVSRVYREKQRGLVCVCPLPTSRWNLIVLDPFFSIPAPSVPYMGPYLNQLITIEVGMSTFVKDPPEHVNFSKLERVRKQVCTLIVESPFTSIGISQYT